MNVVVDTNVVISALLHPGRACVEVIDQILDGHLVWILTPAIVEEYIEVCSRPELRLPEHARNWLIQEWKNLLLFPAPPVGHYAPECGDIDDQYMLNTALYYRAGFLITGNMKHYPQLRGEQLRIVTPRQWLDLQRHRSR